MKTIINIYVLEIDSGTKEPLDFYFEVMPEVKMA